MLRLALGVECVDRRSHRGIDLDRGRSPVLGEDVSDLADLAGEDEALPSAVQGVRQLDQHVGGREVNGGDRLCVEDDGADVRVSGLRADALAHHVGVLKKSPLSTRRITTPGTAAASEFRSRSSNVPFAPV